VLSFVFGVRTILGLHFVGDELIVQSYAHESHRMVTTIDVSNPDITPLSSQEAWVAAIRSLGALTATP
jgi:hypothetical protein